jgi:Ca2+-binding RTX toxin-like protein
LGDEQGILGYGGLGDDRIEGYYGSLAYGGDGNDTLFYSKKMFGEAGNDTLQGYYGNNETFVGGLGADKITTQGGKDVVEYYTLTESGVGAGNRDIITDFDTTSGDVIDLYRLASGLSYISAKAFDGGKNQVRLDIQAANQITVVQVDTDGDKAADMEIELTGIKVLVADDFVLVKPVV